MKHVAAHTAPTGSGFPPFINFAYDETTHEVRILGREGPSGDGKEGRSFELRIERRSAETLFEEGSASMSRLSDPAADAAVQATPPQMDLRPLIALIRSEVESVLRDNQRRTLGRR